MKLYSLRQKIRQEFLLGTFISINAPDLVESLGESGLDFLCLEGEHCAYGIGETEGLIRAANVADLPAIVRIAELGPDIARVLDLGAAGVLVPRIETAEEAREVVRRSRYAPDGERGSGPGRATRYGADMQNYLDQANQNILVLIQIETARGLENADGIAATSGIDGICVGPFDLAMSLGEPIGSSNFREAVAKINSTAKANGLVVVTVAPAPEIVRTARESGDNMVIFGSERMFLAHGMQQLLSAAQ